MGAIDSLGRPHVATYWMVSAARYDLRHIWRNLNGTWAYEAVELNALDASPGFLWYSLELDLHDAPHFLYYDSIRGDVRYAYRNATGWHVEVVQHIEGMVAEGRQGSLALDRAGNAFAAYYVTLSSTDAVIRYAVRGATAWTIEDVEPGIHPSLAVGSDGVSRLAYVWGRPINLANFSFDADLVYRERTPAGWTREVLVDGYQYGNDPANRNDDIIYVPQFTSLALDACNRAHIVTYLNDRVGTAPHSGVVYMTNAAGPCGLQPRSVSIRLEPRTLNLKSNGQWVIATLTTANASARDIEAGSLALNGVPVAQYLQWNGTRMTAKFDRVGVAATLSVGDAVTVTLTGRWRDGGTFTATDTVRVIRPGR